MPYNSPTNRIFAIFTNLKTTLNQNSTDDDLQDVCKRCNGSKQSSIATSTKTDHFSEVYAYNFILQNVPAHTGRKVDKSMEERLIGK